MEAEGDTAAGGRATIRISRTAVTGKKLIVSNIRGVTDFATWEATLEATREVTLGVISGTD